ncbi:MAG: TetR/AcrR family transcriptional regulator [Nocardiopsaceae bacterium]|jgi:AcrR family transcriptional regulator|nr:TetR/AcrR family transcriptional regulator [Nocardiopsaceae bacterium]
MATQPQPMQRPQGRSARIRYQVHRAVIELLEDRTIDELSIPLVAERSGVHQATIYRRWGSIPVLLNDLVAAGPARTAPLPDTGTLREDLDAYAIAVADSLAGPLGVLMLRAAVSNIPPEPDRGPSAILLERTRQLQDMLDRAQARGEHPPSVDELLELVVAPLYFHALFGKPVGPEHARGLVDRLLAPPATRQRGKAAPRARRGPTRAGPAATAPGS